MTFKHFTIGIIIFYLFLIFGIGGAGFYVVIDYFNTAHGLNVPLLLTSIAAIIGGITGIVLAISQWRRAKENPIEKFT